MITLKVTRTKCGENIIFAPRTFNAPMKALLHLAEVELQWAGEIIKVSETRIEIQTRILADIDTAIYEGPADEMKPLLELVSFYDEGAEKYSEVIRNASATALPPGITTQLFTMASPLLIGARRLKVAVMLASGIQDREDIQTGITKELKDVAAAIELANEGLCSFREALAL